MAQSRVTTLDLLAQDFTSMFRHRAFRLEVLDFYDAPNEHEPYTRFLAGEPVDSAWREPWKRLVRGVCDSGRIMQRVQVVTEPVTEYIRFSLMHGKPASVEAGEDVRVLGRAEAASLTLHGDFWLFDDSVAVVLVYNGNGLVQHVELHEDPDLLLNLCGMRDLALRLAVPLARYVSEHRITEGRIRTA